MATLIPEILVTNNPHGILSFGPIGSEDNDDNNGMCLFVDGGYTQLCNKNGNRSEIVPGKSEELCGTRLAQGDQQEAQKKQLQKLLLREMATSASLPKMEISNLRQKTYMQNV